LVAAEATLFAVQEALSEYSETLASSGFRLNIHNYEAASPKVSGADYIKKC
jgi:hypothetical protein